MADWTTIPLAKGQTSDSDDYHSYFYKGSGAAGNNVKIRVQYDKDSLTPTSVKIRFIAVESLVGTSSWEDGFYILYNANDNPTSIGRIGRQVKGKNGVWRDDPTAITITKDYDEDSVTIQDFWICNTGQGSYNASTLEVTYEDGTKTLYNWFKDGAKRENYKTAIGSFTFSGLPTAPTINDPTVTITDNGNNTFSLTSTTGSKKGNSVTATRGWGYTDDLGTVFTNGEDIALTIKTPSNATRKVYAGIKADPAYGSTKWAYANKAIKQYVAPKFTPADGMTADLTSKKSRLTLKESWTLEWDAASPTNSSSPVEGYRIRIWKKSPDEENFSTIKFYSKTQYDESTGKTHAEKLKDALLSDTVGTSASKYVYDRKAELGTTMSITPSLQGLEVGDQVKISLQAYTKDAKGNKLLSSGSEGVWTGVDTIQNAAVVKVYSSSKGKFVEGIVHVYKNGWQEAEAVKVYSASGWKESK